jgi:hypothetical protein
MFPKFSTSMTTYFQRGCNSSVENISRKHQSSLQSKKQGLMSMTFYSVATVTNKDLCQWLFIKLPSSQTHYDHNCDHNFPLYAFLARCVDNHLTTLPTDCKSCESCESNLWFTMKWHLSFSSLHIFNSLPALHWKATVHATTTNKQGPTSTTFH